MDGVFTQSVAQNDICGVVILNPSAVLRMNSVKDVILKLSHYPQPNQVDNFPRPVLSAKFCSAR
jgi:hypothetical protein